MPKYEYSAVSVTGEQISGDYSSPDESGVTAMLRQGGYYPLKIKEKSGGGNLVTKAKIGVKPLAAFCAQMSAMLRAGVPIGKTLDILKTQTEDKNLKLILEDVYNSVHRGNNLSESLQPYSSQFPAIFLNMIEAGEASGMLDQCLERAGFSFTRTAKLNNKVKNATIYPTVILVVLLGLLILMMAFVIPAFTGMYTENDAELPGFTQGLISISDFVTSRWYILLGAAAVVFIGLKTWLSTDAGKTTLGKFLFKAPAVSKLINKVYAARFARTLSSLTAAGVALPHALNVTARSVVNRHMEKEIYKVVDAVNRGEELSQPLERMNL
ncbi:MAG: type II secretion system F family protein, partial [Defluviitaleaceae bacterium]|nr:type II secretion system F family protein [Defluviitaleaceae bacterium]